MAQCLCDFLSTIWLHVRQRKPDSSLDAVLDTLASRQIQIELQDRRCVSEARRHHACGSKALFRAKMLEHRRLQAQLLQLQRYRENVHAQLDALSHHEINQTFMRAMATRPAFDRKDVTKTMDELHESIKDAKEMTELLGEPIEAGVDVLDEDLEQEFMDSMAEEETSPLIVPPAVATRVVEVLPPPRELALPAMMMA
jgi:DNA-binding ferritin-like protein (Dps family)